MFRDCEYVKMTHKDKGVWSMEYGVCAAKGKKSKKVMETIKKFFLESFTCLFTSPSLYKLTYYDPYLHFFVRM